MNLIQLLLQEDKKTLQRILLIVIVTGLANIFAIEVIHTAAESTTSDELKSYLMGSVLCVGIYIGGRKYVLDRSCEVIENIVNSVRHRIADKIRHLELTTLEEISIPSIYARITNDALEISTLSQAVAWNAQALVLILFMLGYIAFLSYVAFLFVALGIILSYWAYYNEQAVLKGNWEKQSEKDQQFFRFLEHLLKGFKELKVNRKKRWNVLDEYQKINEDRKQLRIANFRKYNNNIVSSQVFLYISIVAIIFALPTFHQVTTDVLIKIIAALLFIIGPIEALLSSIPLFSMIDNSVYQIQTLEEKMDEQLRYHGIPSIDSTTEPLPFEKDIYLQGLVYEYPANKKTPAFRVGPLTLTLNKGEIIFITGGNGSGKSTFLKMLTGLYFPQQGFIAVDNAIQVNTNNRANYRDLFALIFTDFHLFDKLYGIEQTEANQVNKLLQNMGLSSEKISYENGQFTNLNLSSGQRKKIALAISLFENKEIYIFDEVAADLDPQFRDVFYYELIPELKARNKTILIVSHDKSYWNTADRILNFENGQLLSQK